MKYRNIFYWKSPHVRDHSVLTRQAPLIEVRFGVGSLSGLSRECVVVEEANENTNSKVNITCCLLFILPA